jgi:outer membrane protein OmpA-like peptidoglycan-associated protein
MKIRVLSAVVLAVSVILGGCTTNPYSGERQMAKSAKYGTIAAVTGGVIGALIGGEKGAYIGAGLGAMTGGGYGYYTDVQEKKLREQIQASNAEMELSRTKDNRLMITMPGDISFMSGSADINPANYQALTVIANEVKTNNMTMMITGHTDNTGSVALNDSLSKARANSVASYMYAQGIPFGAVKTEGLSMHQPIASNATPDGRARNRRVEIILQ